MNLLHTLVMSSFSLGLAAALFANAGPALACSAGPDFDPIDAYDVVVEGRITGWEFIENAETPDAKNGVDPLNGPDYYGPYAAQRFEMDVAQVYKGSAPSKLTMVAGNTAIRRQDGGVDWVGTSGACGAFIEDPTGRWFVMGLSIDNFGRYSPSLFGMFYAGDSTAHAHQMQRVQAIEARLGPARLPGTGGPPAESGNDPLIAGAIVASIILAGGTILLFTRNRARP